MKKGKLISIVIPTFNQEGSIITCLDSIVAQTYNNTQVIVVDDGSTDNTRKLVSNHSCKPEYFFQKNQGPAAARNLGIRNSRGDYLVFLDADDYWKPRFLESCYSFLEDNSDLVAVNTAQKTFLTETKFVISPKGLMIEPPGRIENFFSVWAKHDHIRTGTAMIRKSTVDEAGYQNTKLRISQDLEYWGLIATYGKWGFIPDPLWIGNSRVNAKKSGWKKKYALRRKLCPSVEEWEHRIAPRLEIPEIEHFDVVRGRIALGFAHNQLLGNSTETALNIIKKYGALFPENKLSKLLIFGQQRKGIAWIVVVMIVKFKELLKNIK